MEMAIKDFLAKGAIREVKPQDDQFTSTLFLVQKENGNYRPIINLCALNRFLGKGGLQDGGTASSEISNTAWRLHDEIRPEGCILHTYNSSLRQEVSEVHLSEQGIRVSVPSL